MPASRRVLLPVREQRRESMDDRSVSVWYGCDDAVHCGFEAVTTLYEVRLRRNDVVYTLLDTRST
jgi:hypothetical protein